MKIYVKKICKFVKTDTVLVVSIVLAVISMLAVIYALSDFLIMILSWLVKQSLRAFLFQEVQP